MNSLTNFAAEVEREKGRLRTHDALLKKARAGHVAGGVVFGYRNVPVFDGARRSHVERVPEPAEAAVVRRIFELAAEGLGCKRIAAALNEDGVPAPVPCRRGRPRGWAPSTIREMLFRETYRGVVVWNRTEKLIRQGARRQRERPADDWLRIEAPALRLVPEELWTAVHERLAASRANYLGSTRGRAWGRPANGLESPYLLTGLASCGACGGGMFVHTRSHGHRRVPFLGCMTYHLRGRAVCTNNLEVPLEAADRAVLDAIEQDVLRVEVLETALAKALEALRPAADTLAARRQVLVDQVAQLETEVGRLTAAIVAGGTLPPLVAELQKREQRRAQLEAELAGLERSAHVATLDAGRLLEELRGRLVDWRGLLRQEAAHGRRALMALLEGRLIFAPHDDGRERWYAFTGTGTLGRVLAGLGFQRVWWPQRAMILRGHSSSRAWRGRPDASRRPHAHRPGSTDHLARSSPGW